MQNSALLESIKIWVMDVDGTLTDGSVFYDDEGCEIKKFSVKDGIIFAMVHCIGMKIIILTGRKCKATERRMQDLKPDYLFQGIKDKYHFLKNFMAENHILREELAYIGDDLNDLAAMELAGFVGCPMDACEEVKKVSDYISPLRGGYGAARDVISYVLQKRGEWDKVIRKMYFEQ